MGYDEKQSNERRVLLALAGIVGLALVLSAGVIAQRYWVDDAFISFRYAKNLYEGLGPVYNAGNPVEGYTNFLWVIISCLGLSLDFEPITFAQYVSLAAQCVTLLAVYLLGAEMQTGYRPLIAPLFLASYLPFVGYAMTGMETTFFTMLVTFAVLLVHRGTHHRRAGAVLLAGVLIAIGLTRFDGFVLVGAILSFKIVVDRDFRNLGLAGGLFLAGLAVYNLWRIDYYPTLLPNTFHAKVGFSMHQLKDGLVYLMRFALGGAPHVVLLTATYFALARPNRATSFFAWVSGSHLAYVALVGGDWMAHWRFIVPVMPLLFLLMQQGLWTSFDAAGTATGRQWSNRFACVTVLLVLVGLNLLPLYEGRRLDRFDAAWFRAHEARTVGTHLGRILPPDQWVAIEWAGIVPFYMGHKVLDTFGLTDRDVTQQGFQASVFGRWMTLEYLAGRGPDLVVPCARTFESADAAVLSIKPGGDCHYRIYPDLAGERFGYQFCIAGADEGRFFPVLAKAGSEAHRRICLVAGQAVIRDPRSGAGSREPVLPGDVPPQRAKEISTEERSSQ